MLDKAHNEGVVVNAALQGMGQGMQVSLKIIAKPTNKRANVLIDLIEVYPLTDFAS